MVSEQQARDIAELLSRKYKGAVYSVYRTPSGDHWVRQDAEPFTRVDGIDLVFIAAYLNGKEVRL